VDATKVSGNIITEIMDGIAHARLILGDVSPVSGDYPNANVMYEIGLAHALRQPCEVLLVARYKMPRMFDIGAIRVHTYYTKKPEYCRTEIAGLLTSCLKEIDFVKSVKVQMAIEALDDKCLRLLRNEGKRECFGGLMTELTRQLAQRFVADKQKESGQEAPDEAEIKLAGEVGAASSKYDEHAVTRLLDLGIIRFDHHKNIGKYSLYRWTHLGRNVLVKLGYRKTADVPTYK
jgi:hypothetical protein